MDMKKLQEFVSIMTSPSDMIQYIHTFSWEKAPIDFSDWQTTTAIPVALYLVATYVLYYATNFVRGKPTKDRKRTWFDSLLKFVAIIHNFSLSLLSLLMFYGMFIKGYFPAASKYGAVEGLCASRGSYWESSEPSFWIWVFMVSKWVEFIDTFLRVFMGKPLIFLHVWHHATVPVHMYLMFYTRVDFAMFGFCFNAFVHIIMYFYYGLVAMNIRVWWKELITILQLLQFVLCFVILFVTLKMDECPQIDNKYKIALWSTNTLYLSYLVLFIHFYIQTYKKSEKKKIE